MPQSGRTTKLAQQEDRVDFRSALSRVGVGVVVLTSEFTGEGPRVLFADEGFADLTGYAPDGVRGATLNSLLDAAIGYDELHRLKEKLSADREWLTQVTLRRFDGTPLRVKLKASSLRRDPSGNDPFVVVLNDQVAQLSVMGCVEELQSTMDTVQGVIAVGSWVTELSDRRKMRLSPQMMEMFGLTESELERDSGLFLERVHPDDRERLSRAVRTGLLEHKGFDVQHRIVLPGGEIRWIHARGTMVAACASTPMRLIGVVFDITERVAARNSLAVAEQRYLAASEASQDGLILLQARRHLLGEVEDFVVTDLNSRAAEMLARPRAQLIRGTLRGICREFHDAGHIAHCVQVLKSGVPHLQTSPGTTLGIRAKWIRWNAVPLADGVAISLCDVSWERELSIQVARASRLESIGSLAVSVAHDFNNMLSAILGFGELARDALPASDPVRSDIEQVMQAAGRATQLTRYLLAFGKRQPLEPQRVDIKVTLDELLPILTRLTGPGIEVQTDLAVGLFALVDPSQLEQAIVNLVVNARDAMPHGGLLEIRSSQFVVTDGSSDFARGCSPGDYVCISVVDHGNGMDERTRDRIFEPFFTTKSEHGGTGLGLASVYGFVKQSSGDILVHSELGQGTSIRLLFPMLGAARRNSSIPVPRISEPRTTDTATILLVESDGAVRGVARRMLELHGYSVFEAASVTDAEAALGEEPTGYELLVVALRLSGGNGLEFARRTKLMYPRMRTVLMSGAADMDEIAVAAEQLDARFVQKPFSSVSLAETVREALSLTQF